MKKYLFLFLLTLTTLVGFSQEEIANQISQPYSVAMKQLVECTLNGESEDLTKNGSTCVKDYFEKENITADENAGNYPQNITDLIIQVRNNKFSGLDNEEQNQILVQILENVKSNIEGSQSFEEFEERMNAIYGSELYSSLTDGYKTAVMSYGKTLTTTLKEISTIDFSKTRLGGGNVQAKCSGWWSCWGKCAAGIIGGAGSGALSLGLAGAGVGTVTLPLVGTVSGAALGAIGGAISGGLLGAAASC